MTVTINSFKHFFSKKIFLVYSSEQLIFGQQVNVRKSVRNKVSIIGIGNVGQALAAILLIQKITSNIALVGRNTKKLEAVLLDLQQTKYVDSINVQGSDDYSITSNSHICVLTIGVRSKKGDTRMDSLRSNTKIFFNHVPKLIRHAPESIIIVVSNPVDTLTYLTAKISGFHKNKVFGSGTHLDTLRLRFYISQKYGVSPESCEGWVLGEHGATAVTAFSTCKVGGTFVSDYNKCMGQSDDVDNWNEVHKQVLESGFLIAGVKGYTNWAIALSVGDMIKNILNNTRSVFTITTSAQNCFGINENVYLSLPVVLGEDGVGETIKLRLTDDECAKLRESAKFLFSVQKQLKL
ncbi:hypothetical protein RN001_014881 [Aquatica leii]|uniref:L-lactate dehydrogenase n=1 Tax=Aquatica leii TaxID=1421715 RepID=A0AAN7SBR7_9COLE|nr:hypothetical protein RN001_014881 [Aquatica leii]